MAFDRKSSLTVVGEQAPAPDDALRQMLTTLIHDVLEREFTQFVGAGPYERAASRRSWRNGYRERTWLTRVGPLTLRVPRDRTGRFQPSLFARYERSEKALVLALTEMYIQGVSTRKVTHVVEQLCGAEISASEVSAVVKKLDTELAAWRGRSLAGTLRPPTRRLRPLRGCWLQNLRRIEESPHPAWHVLSESCARDLDVGGCDFGRHGRRRRRVARGVGTTHVNPSQSSKSISSFLPRRLDAAQELRHLPFRA